MLHARRTHTLGNEPFSESRRNQPRNRRRRQRILVGLCLLVNAISACSGLWLFLTQRRLWPSIRLVAGGLAGISLLRARRARGLSLVSLSVLAFHFALVFESIRVMLNSMQLVHEVRYDLKEKEVLVGRHLGYSDEIEIGFAAEFGRSVADSHKQLVREVESFQFDKRANRSHCWRSGLSFQCLPGAYILGMPKCGSSELWERLVKLGALKARRKETRFFTRGEFGMPKNQYLDQTTSLNDFAVAHREAARTILTEIELKGFSDSVIIDGGPHTLWWSGQAHDGTDTGAAPIPHIFYQLAPLRDAFFFITLVEPGRRAYSDYWFLAEDGVVRPDSEAAYAKSPHDFDSKVLHDCKALMLCFDKWNSDEFTDTSQELIANKWTMSAVQTCALDRFHFAQNGRGRLALGLYAAFLKRWFEAGFTRDHFAVLRLEDNFSELPAALERIGLKTSDIFEIDEKHKANTARSARPPMLASTANRLRAFFAPHNRVLASMLNDKRFLWKDAEPNSWQNVTGRSTVANHRKPKMPKRKHSRVDALAPGENWRPSDASPKHDLDIPEKLNRSQDTKTLLSYFAATGINSNYSFSDTDPSDFSTALLMAAMRADAETVSTILNAGADPSAVPADENGITPLHGACLTMAWADSMRDSFVFRVLKGEPSPVDVPLSWSETGRHLTQSKPATSVTAHQIRVGLSEGVNRTISALLKHGADVHASDQLGRTPLHYCAQAGLPIAALLAAGANVSAVENLHGLTPAHSAAVWGQSETVNALEKAGADIMTNLDAHGHSVLDLLFKPVLSSSDIEHLDPEPPIAGGWSAKSVYNASLHSRCDLEIVDSDVTASELYNRFISRNKPVLIRGLASREKWPVAFSAFSASELLAKHGETEVTVSAIPYAKKFNSAAGARGTLLKDFVQELLKVDDDASLSKMASSENRSAREESSELPWYVFRGHPVSQLTGEPDSDWLVPPERIPPPPAIYNAFAMASRFADREKLQDKAKRNEAAPIDDESLPSDPADRFWPFVNVQFAIGGPGSGAPMHFHNTAWNALIYGTKYWIIYPPAFNIMSNQHIRYWDTYDRPQAEAHPYAQQPKPLHCLQRQGDVLIVPELWGHGVVNLHTSIAVATEVKRAQFRGPLPRAFRRIQTFYRNGISIPPNQKAESESSSLSSGQQKKRKRRKTSAYS